MKTPSDGLWPESRLSSYINLHSLQICYVLLAGIAVVALHARFHWPIKLPGHHGLEWIAILIFVRSLSTLSNAGILVASSAAAATAVPIFGFHDYDAAWGYLAAGAVCDFMYRVPRIRSYIIALAVAGGIAHTFKPLLHWAFQAGLGIQHGSLRHGLPNLLVLHFIFGFAGGTCGALMAKITRKGGIP